jgi:hypothetical protein
MNKKNMETSVIEELIIEQTEESLSVTLKDGLIEFAGRSIPEDPVKRFEPIVDWVKEYAQNPNAKTEINLRFEYLNTSSSKHILSILEILDKVYDEDHSMVINWSYEVGDDDMYELGKFYETIIKIPINFYEVEETEFI